MVLGKYGRALEKSKGYGAILFCPAEVRIGLIVLLHKQTDC